MKYLFVLLLSIIFQSVYGGEVATALDEDAVPDISSLLREKRQYHHGGYPNHGYANHYGNGYGLHDYGMMSAGGAGPYQMYPNPADIGGHGASGMGRGGMLNTLMTPFNMFGSMLGLRSANYQNQMIPLTSDHEAAAHYPVAWPYPHGPDTDYKHAVSSDQSPEPVAAYIMSTPNRMQYIYQ